MRFVYAVVYTAAFILAAPYWLVRGLLNRQYLRNLRLRFIGPGRVLPKLGKPRVWVWAMSLGEVLSAQELVKELQAKGCEVIITATTLTGLSMARAAWPQCLILPSPLDFRLSIRRFLDRIEPEMLILVETDIWPGILLEMKGRGIPAALVSARISPRSFKNYRRIKFFWSRILNDFTRIAVQTAEDRDKFLALGAEAARLCVTGNLKFDLSVEKTGPQERAAILSEAGWPEGRYLVAGSTHPGEEQIIMGAYRELLPRFPDLKLLIAPRDRHKFSLAWRLVRENFPETSARRSQPGPGDMRAQVFLLDSLGELARYYELAEIALIGKSWPGAHEGGGHNPLEAAARGKGVISGPKFHNFRWMYQALSQAGGARIAEKQELAAVLSNLLSDPQAAAEMGRRGQEFLNSHRGSVRKTLDFVEPPVPR
jgi:3-deoxy-D-manno-octulosonic-acid transferase